MPLIFPPLQGSIGPQTWNDYMVSEILLSPHELYGSFEHFKTLCFTRNYAGIILFFFGGKVII